MEASHFDQIEFFRAVDQSGARALLIGRQAIITLGLPVVTGDYDFWLHIDDIALFNRALAPFDLVPSCEPDQARVRGRYVLENGERVDVLVARVQPTVDATRVVFDEVWSRRVSHTISGGISLTLPSVADLIATKRFGARPKDAEDIRFLETLLARQG